MPQAKILWDDSVGAFRVSTPYSASFVDLLKQLIPIADRVWDPQSKIWTVDEKYGRPIKGLCESVWGAANVQYMDRAAMAAAQAAQQAAYAKFQQAQAAQNAGYVPPPPPRSPVRGDPLDIVLLNFAKLLPYEAAKAAYRKASMELHPDRNNGNGDAMSALNAAWSRIETEFYRKGGTT